MVKVKLSKGWDRCSKEGHALVEADSMLGQSIPNGVYCARCGITVLIHELP